MMLDVQGARPAESQLQELTDSHRMVIQIVLPHVPNLVKILAMGEDLRAGIPWGIDVGQLFVLIGLGLNGLLLIKKEIECGAPRVGIDIQIGLRPRVSLFTE